MSKAVYGLKNYSDAVGLDGLGADADPYLQRIVPYFLKDDDAGQIPLKRVGNGGWQQDFNFSFHDGRLLGLKYDSIDILRQMFAEYVAKVEAQIGVERFLNRGWIKVGDMSSLQGITWHQDVYPVQTLTVYDFPGRERLSEIQVLTGSSVAVICPERVDLLLGRGMTEAQFPDRDYMSTQDSAVLIVAQDILKDSSALRGDRFGFLHRRAYLNHKAPMRVVVDRVLMGAGWEPGLCLDPVKGVEQYQVAVRNLVERGLFGEDGKKLLQAVNRRQTEVFRKVLLSSLQENRESCQG